MSFYSFSLILVLLCFTIATKSTYQFLKRGVQPFASYRTLSGNSDVPGPGLGPKPDAARAAPSVAEAAKSRQSGLSRPTAQASYLKSLSPRPEPRLWVAKSNCILPLFFPSTLVYNIVLPHRYPLPPIAS